MQLVFIVVEPWTASDTEKLAGALRELTAADANLRIGCGVRTNETIIRGTDEQHLETVADRLALQFGVEASISGPQVLYRETVSQMAEFDCTHKKQWGGFGQYARCKLRIEPNPGLGFSYIHAISEGHIPERFLSAIEEGVESALEWGENRYPIIDVKVSLLDGAYHDVDSSESTFRICASICIHVALREARPVRLEPVMHVQVNAPRRYMGLVGKELTARRGLIQRWKTIGDARTTKAIAPLAEMFGYGERLRSATNGLATFSMLFNRFEPVRDEGEDGPQEESTPVGVPRPRAPKGDSSSVRRTLLPEGQRE